MKRRLAKLLVFLLLGAIVNVAVAWGSAVSVSMYGEPDDCAIGRLHNARWSLWSVLLFSKVGSDFCYSTLYSDRRHQPPSDSPGAIVPEWFPDHLAWTTEARAHVLAGEARGWPCRALRALWEIDLRDGVNGHRVVSGIDLISFPWRTPVGVTLPRILPLRPIWPGFAINTIFYAAALWVVFLIPGMIKRTRRRFRGLCIHCGYDLRGQTTAIDGERRCPECGKAMPGRNAAQRAAAPCNPRST
jgi:hypothetical protein